MKPTASVILVLLFGIVEGYWQVFTGFPPEEWALARRGTQEEASSSKPRYNTPPPRVKQLSPEQRAKNKLKDKNPVTVSLRTTGPAVVRAWEGKMPSYIPKVERGQTVNIGLADSRSAMVHVKHEDHTASTVAIGTGKVAQAAARELRPGSHNPDDYSGRTRVYDPQRERGRRSELHPVPYRKAISNDLSKPAHIMGELHGVGLFGIKAANQDSGSESD